MDKLQRLDHQQEVDVIVSAIRRIDAFGQRLETIEAMHDDLKGDVAHALSGFPGEDPDGHRRYHEAKIKLTEERAELYKAVRERLVSGVAWGALVGIGMLIWWFVTHIPQILMLR
jgi:hypothetical protein